MKTSPLKRLTLLTLALALVASCGSVDNGEKKAKPKKEELDELYTFEGLADDFSLIFSNNKIRVDSSESGSTVRVVRNYQEPKEMMRATWIATVAQLHYPRKNANGTPRLALTELQSDWLEILHNAQSLNLNTIIFQVSPTLDAFYASAHRPWSALINPQNRQGVAPEWAGRFDLIEWMIEETHQRGMEFHAWFNPYRVTADTRMHQATASDPMAHILNQLDANNFARKNPDAAYLFVDNKVYLDPGSAKTQAHIQEVIHEFITRYDADAIHFDDYFYPYPVWVNGEKISFRNTTLDHDNFRDNPRNFRFSEQTQTPRYQQEVEKWRKDNNDQMVKNVANVIAKHNATTGKAVQWGISPFGIWEHFDIDRRGTFTRVYASSSRRDIYADTLKWAQEETIDYIIPQVYWHFESTVAPYSAITYWWQHALRKSRTQLIIGHPNFKTNQEWENYHEITNQLRYNARFPKIQGSAFFSYNDLIPARGATRANTIRNKELDALREHMQTITPNPPRPWLDQKETLPLQNLQFNPREKLLTFQDTLDNDSRFYLVYGIQGLEKELILMVGRNKKSIAQSLSLRNINLDKYEALSISIKDFAGVESLSQVITL